MNALPPKMNHPRPSLYRPWLAVLLALAVWPGQTGFSQGVGVSPVLLTDSFASRPAITLFPDTNSLYARSWEGIVYGSNSNATIETEEPYIAGVASGQTVWGTWTPPAKGIVTLSAAAETFSPLLTVYAGSSLPTLSLVASNTYEACYDGNQGSYTDPAYGDACGCHWRERNQTTFHVAGGQPYQICLDSAIITDAAWVSEEFPAGTLPMGPYQWSDLQMMNLLSEPSSNSFFVPIQTTNVLAGGDFSLNFQFTASPANDDFANRLKLSGARVSLLATNAGATKEVGEPDHGGNPGGSSVWYSWTAPASGRVTLSTNQIAAFSPPASTDGSIYGLEETWSGSMGFTFTSVGSPPTCGNEIDQDPPPVFYPVFGVYTGTAVNALTNVNPLPIQAAGDTNILAFDAVKGQTYQIAFDGNAGTTGITPLYLNLTTPAANSTFNNRILLHGVSVIATGYNVSAAHQNGLPILPVSTGKTVWWSWRAPVSGTVTLDLTGSDYAFPLAVFTGSSPAALKLVAEGSGALSFNAVEGVTYQIAVADADGQTGAVQLGLLAPIIDLPLVETHRSSRNAWLVYGSANRTEIVAFLSSTDNFNWHVVATSVPQSYNITFEATPPPTPTGPFYRAIIFDRARW